MLLGDVTCQNRWFADVRAGGVHEADAELCASGRSPIVPTGPAQNARSPPKNILPTGVRCPSISTQQRYSRSPAGSVSPLAMHRQLALVGRVDDAAPAIVGSGETDILGVGLAGQCERGSGDMGQPGRPLGGGKFLRAASQLVAGLAVEHERGGGDRDQDRRGDCADPREAAAGSRRRGGGRHGNGRSGRDGRDWCWGDFGCGSRIRPTSRTNASVRSRSSGGGVVLTASPMMMAARRSRSSSSVQEEQPARCAAIAAASGVSPAINRSMPAGSVAASSSCSRTSSWSMRGS